MHTLLQSPLGNPVANNNVLKFFPSFAPAHLTVAGGLLLLPAVELPRS